MAAVVLFGTACGGGPAEDELDEELDRLLARTRTLAARAEAFDHDRVLWEIGADPANGTPYRFDDHLGDASYEAIGRAPAELRPVMATLDLMGGHMQPGGIVAYPVDLPTRDIGALELRIVSPLGGRLEIELQGEQTGEAVTIDLHAVGDGELSTPTASSLQRLSRRGPATVLSVCAFALRNRGTPVRSRSGVPSFCLTRWPTPMRPTVSPTECRVEKRGDRSSSGRPRSCVFRCRSSIRSKRSSTSAPRSC